MKTKFLALITLIVVMAASVHAAPLGTAFSYQGRLTHGSNPADGIYDFIFAVFDSPTGASQLGASVMTNGLPVSNGLFIATLDFGPSAFMGEARWLAIGVRTNGSPNAHVPLLPRQPLTPAPYALHAANAANLMSSVNQPLDIKVNGQRALRFEPTSVPNTVNVIGGSPYNFVAPGAVGSTIAGGGGNVEGPRTNSIEASFATISGGARNSIQPFADFGTIGGGYGNKAGYGAEFPTIAGGWNNSIESGASSATISGGSDNIIQTNASAASIGGGARNVIGRFSNGSVITGGTRNKIDAASAVIVGGELNVVGTGAEHSFIGGGYGHRVQAGYTTIGGGENNSIEQGTVASTIAGGAQNLIQSNANHASIAGGERNYIKTNAISAVISGGARNSAAGFASAVSGGHDNQAMGTRNTVGGGGNNLAAGFDSTVGGGFQNTADGFRSTVPGGAFNTTSGDYSFAAGRRAKAYHQGAFVWADSADADFASTGHNQFLIRADRVGIGLNNPQKKLHVNGDHLMVEGVNGEKAYFGADGGGGDMDFGSYNPAIVQATLWNQGYGGTMDLHVRNLFQTSDRNLKTNFHRIDGRKILERLSELPIQTWQYKQSTNSTHIGPTAQDFHAAFRLGENDTAITTIDADGVALAAIQGLNQKLEEALKARDAELWALQQRLADLEKFVTSLNPKGTRK